MNRNDLAIESFISYCDEMMIAEEGIKDMAGSAVNGVKKAGAAAWKGIKQAVTTLRELIKKILFRIKSIAMSKEYTMDYTKYTAVVQHHKELAAVVKAGIKDIKTTAVTSGDGKEDLKKYRDTIDNAQNTYLQKTDPNKTSAKVVRGDVRKVQAIIAENEKYASELDSLVNNLNSVGNAGRAAQIIGILTAAITRDTNYASQLIPGAPTKKEPKKK